MTKEEVLRCCVLIKDIQKLKRTTHLIKKDIKYNMGGIYQTLKNPNLHEHIIEYNETYDSRNERWTQRVLINIPKLVKFKTRNGVEEGYLKVVIDVTTKTIITVYYNLEDDNHVSLDLKYYNSKIKVRPSKSGGYKNINPGVAKQSKNKNKIS